MPLSQGPDLQSILAALTKKPHQTHHLTLPTIQNLKRKQTTSLEWCVDMDPNIVRSDLVCWNQTFTAKAIPEWTENRRWKNGFMPPGLFIT